MLLFRFKPRHLIDYYIESFLQNQVSSEPQLSKTINNLIICRRPIHFCFLPTCPSKHRHSGRLVKVLTAFRSPGQQEGTRQKGGGVYLPVAACGKRLSRQRRRTGRRLDCSHDVLVPALEVNRSHGVPVKLRSALRRRNSSQASSREGRKRAVQQLYQSSRYKGGEIKGAMFTAAAGEETDERGSAANLRGRESRRCGVAGEGGFRGGELE